MLRPFAPRGRLVEIGPAVGAFLAVSQEAGYSVEAVEMDAACCSFLERELGVRTVRSDDPASALDAAGQFDVIALWQVLEHLPDPAGPWLRPPAHRRRAVCWRSPLPILSRFSSECSDLGGRTSTPRATFSWFLCGRSCG